MKLKFVLAAIFGVALLTNGSYIALAQSSGDRKAGEIKSKVEKRLGNGKIDVKVEKFDGTKLKGKITKAGDTSFTIVESTSNQSTEIAYGDTKKLKGTGWPTSGKIAIGVGAAAGATLIVLLIAFKHATRNN